MYGGELARLGAIARAPVDTELNQLRSVIQTATVNRCHGSAALALADPPFCPAVRVVRVGSAPASRANAPGSTSARSRTSAAVPCAMLYLPPACDANHAFRDGSIVGQAGWASG